MEKTIHRPEYRALIDRLVAARKAKGLTQEDVAQALGVRQTWVSKVEKCERRLDILETVDLCKYYGLALSELLSTQPPRKEVH
ncbi:MAG: transcriptional regulator [Leptospiraceae bacterium]|nr:transcriptional regulator [Leptospiraceae bacterium]